MYSKAPLYCCLAGSPLGDDSLLKPPTTGTEDCTVMTGDFHNILFQPQLDNTPMKLTTTVQALEKEVFVLLKLPKKMKQRLFFHG